MHFSGEADNKNCSSAAAAASRTYDEEEVRYRALGLCPYIPTSPFALDFILTADWAPKLVSISEWYEKVLPAAVSPHLAKELRSSGMHVFLVKRFREIRQRGFVRQN